MRERRGPAKKPQKKPEDFSGISLYLGEMSNDDFDPQEMMDAVEEGCRYIEARLEDRGRRVKVSVDHMVTGYEGFPKNEGYFRGELYGRYLGPSPVKEAKPLSGMRSRLLGPGPTSEVVRLRTEDRAGSPSVVDDIRDAMAQIPDRGHAAGVKALLEKYRRAIENATLIAEGGKPTDEYRVMLDRAGDQRSGDPVVRLIQVVLAQHDELTDTQNELVAARLAVEKDEDPEEQLRRRLRLKVKARYAGKREMLKEFQTYLVDNYSAHFPGHRPDALDSFLEQYGEDDGHDV